MNLLNDDKELIPYKSFKQCLLITLSVALGTFGLSYNTYLLNGPLEYIRIWLQFNDSPKRGFLEGVLQAAFNFGGLIGCIIGFLIVKSAPRRYMIFLIDSLLITGTLGLMIGNYYSFSFFRVIAGLGAGLTTLVTPMFLKEILPTKIYGVLGGQNLVFLSLGTIVQSVSALGFKDVKGQKEVDITYWRFYLLPPVIICFLRTCLLLFFFKHESPYYLLQKGKKEECQKFIEYVYKPKFVAEVEQDFMEAVSKRSKDQAIPRSRFTLGVLMNIFYANSGITPITSYSTLIFSQVASNKVSQILTIGMSVIKFILYSTGAQLTQKFGRRKPLLLGTIILAVVLICSSGTSYINDQPEYDGSVMKSISVYLLVVAIYLYFGVFFNTFGVIIPLYTPEILSGNYLTVALVSQWIFNITVTFLFPVAREYFGIYITFLYFGIMMVVATIYFYIFVKETRNLTEAEINKLWNKKTDVFESISEQNNLLQ